MLEARTGETTGRDGWRRALAGLFAGSCFFPYPAIAIGSSNGLQLSHMLAIAGAPLLCFRPPDRAFRAYLILMVPIYVSMFWNIMFGDVPEVKILPKEAISLTVAMLILWPAGWVASPGRFRFVLKAAAAAIIVHALVGLIQVYSFAHDEFPLLFLYKNPSFKSMEEWAVVFATYIKRPCGIFPEPSAMGASLGPWLVLLTGLWFDPRAGRAFSWRGGTLAAVAAASGFLLIALSRSGSVFAMMASILFACGGELKNRVRALGTANVVTLAVIVMVADGVMAYAATNLSSGFEERVDTSWGLRAMSIEAGLTSNADPASLALGVGPGQSTPLIRRQLAGVPLIEDQEELAIFSLTVCYYMETGLMGAVAMLAVLVMAIQAIRRSSASALGFGALATWIMGVAATTSYMHLSPIWLFLAVLLSWDVLFPRESALAVERAS